MSELTSFNPLILHIHIYDSSEVASFRRRNNSTQTCRPYLTHHTADAYSTLVMLQMKFKLWIDNICCLCKIIRLANFI